MAESTEIRWKRSTTEAAVIVVSILLAFSIDAWWQDHVEDEREREVLIALLDDFRNTRENIRDWRNFHLAVQASTKELLQAVTAGDQTLAEEEVERLLGDLGWWDSQSHFSTGALYSLVYGDELSIIEDSALRQMLADWPSKIEHVGVVQGQDYDFFLSVWTPI